MASQQSVTVVTYLTEGTVEVAVEFVPVILHVLVVIILLVVFVSAATAPVEHNSRLCYHFAHYSLPRIILSADIRHTKTC